MKGAVFLGVMQMLSLHAAILPPPWADPEKNPCATQPGGWLLVHWPPDGKCYRIFHRGHPCPDTMELNPLEDASHRITAECRCPPRTAQTPTADVCYPINTRGPCERGQYFAPLRLSPPPRQRIGHCVTGKQCRSEEVFWPATGQCYPSFTRGPCPEGQLLVLNQDTQLGECQCSASGPLAKYFWPHTNTCHEHHTRGPCLEKGTLFLPGPTCGCHQALPNYHPDTDQCYEIGTIGPCKPGHRFDMEPPKAKATCLCKPQHVLWDDGQCYRLYTRGPCPPGDILFPNQTCAFNPCPKGKLYLPEDGSCHRVGVRGPCPKGQLVLFDQSIRPSVDGISYRGMCGCSGPDTCTEQPLHDANQESRAALNTIGDAGPPPKSPRTALHKLRICDKHEKPSAHGCHALYSQGPCAPGEWLVPARQPRTHTPPLLHDDLTNLKARCDCRPGHSRPPGAQACRLPLLTLANFLNGHDLFS